MRVEEHYDKHLAHFYSWMVGDLNIKTEELKNFLSKNGIHPSENKVAIDLEAGNGIQSIALKELGFDVTAIDFNDLLLDELESNPRGKGINNVRTDIKKVSGFKDIRPELISCCGDTITHPKNKKQIEKLLKDSADILEANGKLILTFRDYSNELIDKQRFIPVKSSADRILTCILEYGTEKVKVTDLLHDKTGNEWTQKVCSYEKVRISPKEVVEFIETNGMKIIFNETVNKLQIIIAEKIA